MTQLDRLPWSTGVAVRSYGVRVGVRAMHERLLQSLPDYLPPGYTCLDPGAAVDRIYSLQIGSRDHLATLHANGVLLGRDLAHSIALLALEADLQTFLSEAARRHVFVHAGAVEWRGRAIIVPGEANRGKTTLVEQLLRSGATYYSDEYAVLDARGLVRPFARRLGIRGSEGSAFSRPSAAEIGAPTGVTPIPIGLLLLTEYREGAAWQPQRLSAAEGALHLLRHTLRARRGSEFVLTVFQRALAHARVLAGSRGDAPEFARALLGGITSWNAIEDD